MWWDNTLSVLSENNLIEYLDVNQTFKTTEKGLNYLRLGHNSLNEYCNVNNSI